MRIAAVTICVGYADYLARGAMAWKRGLDDWMIVSTIDDLETHALCAAAGLQLSRTSADAVHDGGATFNKAIMLQAGLMSLQSFEADDFRSTPLDWILLLDADLVPPLGWRAQLETSDPHPGSIYGARRFDEAGRAVNDSELPGCFQLFHASDPLWTADPTLGSWANASGYDSALLRRWPPDRRVVLPLDLVHLGRPHVNWCGVGRADLMAQMWERRKREGWQAERLDR